MDLFTVWRRIEGFSQFEVSDSGDVRRAKDSTVNPGRLVERCESDSGYPRVNMVGDDGRRVKRLVHLLVLAAFKGGAPSSRHVGAHKNGKQDDCSADNLEWKLPVENEADKKRHGTAPRGGRLRRIARAKITEIHTRLARGETISSVARAVGVHRRTVARMKRGERHVMRAA